MKTSEFNDLNSQSLDGGRTSCKYVPRPVSVTYNNWRDVEVPSPEAFVPSLPVSIIVPYYERPEELARTLASLERQTYPRDLFEVIVVDDGSRPPLERPEGTPLDIKVVHHVGDHVKARISDLFSRGAGDRFPVARRRALA